MDFKMDRNQMNADILGYVKFTLTSKKAFLLEKTYQSIIHSIKQKTSKRVNSKKIPTKSLAIVTRKSPCGQGTNTWDHFEFKIYKRVVSFISSNEIINHITAITIESGVEIEISYYNKKAYFK